MKMLPWRVLWVLMVAAGTAYAQGPAADKPAEPKPKPDKPTLVIQGGDIYPIRGPIIRGGMLLIEDGRITALGARVDVPEGAEVIDATGKVVMPGLVAANLSGLVPGSAKKIGDALDPYHSVVAFALASGLTSAYVQAGSPNDRGFSIANGVIKMTEGDLKGMLLREPVAINLAWEGRSSQQRAQLRQALADAAAYLRRKAEYEKDKAAGKKVEEPKVPGGTEEALRLLRRELPARASASYANEIQGVLGLATEFGFRVILEDLVTGWTVPQQIAHAGAEWHRLTAPAGDARPGSQRADGLL